eukprot:Clim_evm88s210 gene=Clim_evmTU88s210
MTGDQDYDSRMSTTGNVRASTGLSDITKKLNQQTISQPAFKTPMRRLSLGGSETSPEDGSDCEHEDSEDLGLSIRPLSQVEEEEDTVSEDFGITPRWGGAHAIIDKENANPIVSHGYSGCQKDSVPLCTDSAAVLHSTRQFFEAYQSTTTAVSMQRTVGDMMTMVSRNVSNKEASPMKVENEVGPKPTGMMTQSRTSSLTVQVDNKNLLSSSTTVRYINRSAILKQADSPYINSSRSIHDDEQDNVFLNAGKFSQQNGSGNNHTGRTVQQRQRLRGSRRLHRAETWAPQFPNNRRHSEASTSHSLLMKSSSPATGHSRHCSADTFNNLGVTLDDVMSEGDEDERNTPSSPALINKPQKIPTPKFLQRAVDRRHAAEGTPVHPTEHSTSHGMYCDTNDESGNIGDDPYSKTVAAQPSHFLTAPAADKRPLKTPTKSPFQKKRANTYAFGDKMKDSDEEGSEQPRPLDDMEDSRIAIHHSEEANLPPTHNSSSQELGKGFPSQFSRVRGRTGSMGTQQPSRKAQRAGNSQTRGAPLRRHNTEVTGTTFHCPGKLPPFANLHHAEQQEKQPEPTDQPHQQQCYRQTNIPTRYHSQQLHHQIPNSGDSQMVKRSSAPALVNVQVAAQNFERSISAHSTIVATDSDTTASTVSSATTISSAGYDFASGDFSTVHGRRGDGQALSLPLVSGTHDVKRISGETLLEVMNGSYNHNFDRVIIVDARYPYEYEGGHLKGAVNLYTQEMVLQYFLDEPQESPNAVIIFHCEYSQKRGPKLCRYFRNMDRYLNSHRYPQVYYPELYVLDGGYRGFFQNHGSECSEPPAYVSMIDERFANELKHFERSCNGQSRMGRR